MSTIIVIFEDIADKPENFSQYLSREDAMLVKITEESLIRKAAAKLEWQRKALATINSEIKAKDAELKAKKLALKEIQAEAERYKQALVQAGIDPNQLQKTRT